MARSRLVRRLITGCVLLQLVVLVSADQPVRPAASAVTVTVRQGADAVEGAFVALVGPGAKYATLTDAAGLATFSSVEDGVYTAVASATGTTVAHGSIIVPDTLAVTLSVKASGSMLTGLGAYGSQTQSIWADGRSGVFYLSTDAVPSVYRTADYGGTWRPVTLSNDDPDYGVDASQRASALTTSGFPGEVAVAIGTALWYSQDFGVTWTSLPLPSNFSMSQRGRQLLWGHPGAPAAPSVLFLVDDTSSTRMFYAVMPTRDRLVAPSGFTEMTSSYRAATGDRVAIGNGSDAPVIAVSGAADGVVRLYTVDSTPDAGDSAVSITGAVPTLATDASPLAPADVFFLRIGGPATGRLVGDGTRAPATLVVYSNSNDSASAALATTCGQDSCATTTTTAFKDTNNATGAGSFHGGFGMPTTCGANREAGAIGSVSPLGTNGTIGSCWLTVAGSTLEVRQVQNINNNTGFAFDAGYDGAANQVVISGDGSHGGAKSARAGAGGFNEPSERPYFPPFPALAAAGTGPASGGVAITGLDAAVINDTVFNPDTPTEIAAMMGFTGGGRVVGSTDAGDTWFTLQDRGGWSLDWWDGTAGRQWLLAAKESSVASMLSVASLTVGTPFSTSTTLSDVAGTAPPFFGLIVAPGVRTELRAVAGIPGSEVVYVAALERSTTPPGGVGRGSLTRVTLDPGTNPVGASGIVVETILLSAPVALAYCPAAGSHAAVADKLFAAVGASQQGGTEGGVRIGAGAAAGVPAMAAVAGLSGDFRDVRVDCATGVVWAGRRSSTNGGPPSAGLFRSTDGGATFSAVTATGSADQILRDVETLDLNPLNGDHLVVASGTGDMASTTDGGVTWEVRNDTSTAECANGATSCGRSFGGQAPGDLEFPPAAVPGGTSARAAVQSDYALLASASGLFTANVGAPMSLGGISPGAGAMTGGAAVALSGANFTNGATVSIGGVPATAVTFVSATMLTAIVPPAAVAGAAEVLVTLPDGQTASLPGGYVYLAIADSTVDTDGDGMPDQWEAQFSLDPTANDAGADADGDGRSNAQELAAGTHPRGFYTRLMPEGASSSFFRAVFAVLNANDAPAEVLFRFLKSDGTVATQYVGMLPSSRATLDASTVPGMPASMEFSTVVESDVPVVVDRTMSWDSTGYGSHAESSLAAPASTWYLAEGATHSGFDLFYLLQNPNSTAAEVQVEYLLPAPQAPITERYTVNPSSRFTIWVDQIAGLDATDVSAVITSLNGVPILVERAMYLNSGGQMFGAGHDAAGVTTPAESWILAEGATGPYFDLFLLLANPGVTPAEVEATYLLADGTSLTLPYTVEAQSRKTVWVDYEAPRLADAAVSTVVRSTNGVPVIVERAMWWPGSPATWAEAHDAVGTVSTGTVWAMANGEVGGAAGTDTYILIANTSDVDGSVEVTLFFEDGTRVARTFTVRAHSRFNIFPRVDFPTAIGRRFGSLVESVSSPAVQIVVEQAMYSDAGGVRWAAGTDAVATKVR